MTHLDATEIAKYLSCPDESGALEPWSAGLRCTRCSREFHFLRPNLLEILPSGPVQPSAKMPSWYAESYRPAYQSIWRDGGVRPEEADRRASKVAKRQERHTAQVFRMLRDGGGGANGVFCDLSAGVGHTTFAAARHARLVFHCDLSIQAVDSASSRAARMGLQNLLAVRADYFRPPFRACIEELTCLDSLIRGPWHELRLLRSICQTLAPGGRAAVDFHNWWHNPLRRLGLLRQNFGQNRSYTKRQVEQLLRQAGIDEFTIRGFVQEADALDHAGRVLQRFVPPTRFLVRWKAPTGSHKTTAAG